MGKDKIRRFEAVKKYANFHEPKIKERYHLKGKWHEKQFQNSNPIILELGCGKGEYTVGLAKRFPNKNFVGVDIKGARMYVGATEAIEQKLDNVAFCRTRIDFINDCFAENEVAEIWLTFSDPQPKKSNKRLTSPVFIEKYKHILQEGGYIHVKTDSDLLFKYTEEQINQNSYKCEALAWDLYNRPPKNNKQEEKEILSIQTHYEKLFTKKGAVIKYCKFRVD